MPAAARVGDFHSCPKTNPPPANSPHVGGPILPPGIKNVLIGNMPAATGGDKCLCTGEPDTIKKGSSSVTINGKAAARKGDLTVHGGEIKLGFPTVIIGG